MKSTSPYNPSFWKPGSMVACLQCFSTTLVYHDISKSLLTMVSQSHLQIISQSWDIIHLVTLTPWINLKRLNALLKSPHILGFKSLLTVLVWYFRFTKHSFVRNMEAKIGRSFAFPLTSVNIIPSSLSCVCVLCLMHFVVDSTFQKIYLSLMFSLLTLLCVTRFPSSPVLSQGFHHLFIFFLCFY